MKKNRKLRLLVTEKCKNKCPMCCNNSWDFSKLPVVDNWDYDEIMITGGEPLLNMPGLINILEMLGCMKGLTGQQTKVYIYTAYPNSEALINAIIASDGIVFTPHNERAIQAFVELNNMMLREKYAYKSLNKSLRLNLFKDMKEMLPKDIDLSLWKVKDMVWIKDCPIPEGEDFRRIAQLW